MVAVFIDNCSGSDRRPVYAVCGKGVGETVEGLILCPLWLCLRCLLFFLQSWRNILRNLSTYFPTIPKERWEIESGNEKQDTFFVGYTPQFLHLVIWDSRHQSSTVVIVSRFNHPQHTLPTVSTVLRKYLRNCRKRDGAGLKDISKSIGANSSDQTFFAPECESVFPDLPWRKALRNQLCLVAVSYTHLRAHET